MGLKGDLRVLPLPDLVEMTAVGNKTGRLVLYDEEDAVAGVLTFRAGRLVGAKAGELTAEKAFYALLALTTGSFEFDSLAVLEADDVDLPTPSLLIEGMRRLDETYRLRQRLPAPAMVHYVGGLSDDPLEKRVLGHVGPGARTVGDITEGMLVAGDADEYDVLRTLDRLVGVGMVRLDPATAEEAAHPGGPPQPELER